MTVRDSFIIALSVMNVQEDDSSDYTPTVVPVVNLLLTELFDVNNSMRVSAGLAPLAGAQRVSALTDELIYDDALMTDTLPFGLATYLVREDDPGLSSFCNAKYEEGKRRRAIAELTSIRDVYAGGDT